jgi:hypothetical protein
MATGGVDQILRDARINATIAWLLTGAIVLVALASMLEANLLWAGFASAVVALVVVPPVAFRSPRTMLPWEILLLAGLPILGRAVATFQVSSQVATYLSVAALALIVAVELHTFTTVRMTPTFAVVFVAITTMAVAGIWAVVRWSLDVLVGTAFLLDSDIPESAIEEGVMLEFVASTVAGILAGIVFEFYVRRRARIRPRLPDHVEPAGEPPSTATEPSRPQTETHRPEEGR